MVYVTRTLTLVVATLVLATSVLAAQTPVRDPSDRIKAVLPADVAARVLATIAFARARDLPATALEQRALKFAAKGVAPSDIESSVFEQAGRMGRAKEALEARRGMKPSFDEIDAGADAMRKGLDAAGVSALAKRAPSGRSLAVPLYAIASLIDRGLPADEALSRVQKLLQARATDAELDRLSTRAGTGRASTPAEMGRAVGATLRPGSAGRAGVGGAGVAGPPAGVPSGTPGRPTTPGSGRRP